MSKVIFFSFPIILGFASTAFATYPDVARFVYEARVTHPDVLKANSRIAPADGQFVEVIPKDPVHFTSIDQPDLMALRICQEANKLYQGVKKYSVLNVSIFGRSKVREFESIVSVTCIQATRAPT
jgi:hypothetical protein